VFVRKSVLSSKRASVRMRRLCCSSWAPSSYSCIEPDVACWPEGASTTVASASHSHRHHHRLFVKCQRWQCENEHRLLQSSSRICTAPILLSEQSRQRRPHGTVKVSSSWRRISTELSKQCVERKSSNCLIFMCDVSSMTQKCRCGYENEALKRNIPKQRARENLATGAR